MNSAAQGAQVCPVMWDDGAKRVYIEDNDEVPVVVVDPTTGSLKSGSAFIGASPTGEYVGMFPCKSPAGVGSAKASAKLPGSFTEIYPSSLTGRGTLTDAQMWANDGWISTTAGAGGQAEIPIGGCPILFNQFHYLISFNIKGAAPASINAIFGQGNPTNSSAGLCLRSDTAGKIQVLYITGGVATNLGTSNGVFLDSTEHTASLYISPTGRVVLFRDGEVDCAFPPNNAAVIGSITETQPLTIGGAAASNGTAIALQFRAIHILKFSRQPLNIGQIVKNIFSSPDSPIQLTSVIYPTTVLGCYWGAAQSNEYGAGNTIAVSGSLGIPHKDSVTGRSIITSLSQLTAQRGVALEWATTAFGTTSAAGSWCGRIRTWVSGLQLGSGSYVTYGGHTWKCTNSLGFSGQSTVAPVAGTGADSVTWSDLGISTADDLATLAGTGVFSSTSSRWDPNGLLSTAIAKAALVKAYSDKLVCFISLGQQDRYEGTPRAAYSDALQKLAAFNLANGADIVLIGMTVRSSSVVDYSSFNGGGAANAANTTADNWYNTHLIPGRLDALSALSQDPRVKPGHDWASYIGPVADQSYATGIGVKATDHVHMTDATYETLAVPCVNSVLKGIGY